MRSRGVGEFQVGAVPISRMIKTNHDDKADRSFFPHGPRWGGGGERDNKGDIERAYHINSCPPSHRSCQVRSTVQVKQSNILRFLGKRGLTCIPHVYARRPFLTRFQQVSRSGPPTTCSAVWVLVPPLSMGIHYSAICVIHEWFWSIENKIIWDTLEVMGSSWQ